jgi:hypothetical protein
MNKKMFHSSSHFDFALVNISSKHLGIPLQNNILGEIAKYTIHV